ncbi:MAG: 50S ribosomal protein L35 [Deltaproteobacteria bacterium RIFCSPLOWO2_12_FULL_40_28]|nr:MAG: 50S ribosomal protein L35 [Deltaproteobacteria bacterium RIFCSPHIGHO2_02_FULL_40_28]OGQ21003.1 MAG: 50S ribosomal protein L35 [Deltaproteobacteria bacterium RIFCSPHIGHO2_12_FULL_40_32]OGQ39404.1 MAG: 50S ribosomal protein L35 [Deltaproteobacteria bacterium RIFCSPLOWO2_02_FULL_40_36]OGQ54685.1 MAG: 50S ribosomal protein L35 [Deltaproteobacteria bacterium RIFCSPLOWO2_12_FULL_40_28]
MPKLKTNRGAKKRFRPTKNKIKYSKAKRRHLLESKSPKKSRDMRRATYVHPSNIRQVRAMLPYA